MSDPLDRILFESAPNDYFRVRDACEGVLITGGIGSGKTSGSGHLLASHYLSNGFSGTILTAKADEKNLWIKYCKKYGRLDDLVIVSPYSGHRFNFMEYEISRGDDGRGIVHNIADILLKVLKSCYPEGAGTDQGFWDSSIENLVVNAVDLAMMTGNKRLENIHDIIVTAPRTHQERRSSEFRASSKCFRALEHVSLYIDGMQDSEEKKSLRRRFKPIDDFFPYSWINFSEKTRSIVEQMFINFGSRFMREPLYSLFNTDTTFSPDDVLQGKIILIDMPVLTYDRTGQDAQILWKYIFQRAMLRRTIKKYSPPIFLWVDECQYFINPEQDAQFQSTCRDKRVCSVYITQNLPNFYVNAGGGEKGKILFKALAGNLTTKIFHANSDVDTNEYAADLIGKEWVWSENQSIGIGENISINRGASEILSHIIEPSQFAKLLTGGPLNDKCVQAIIHRQGKIFRSTQNNHQLITLKQTL